MEFRLKLALTGGFFAVPNTIIDQHMKLCSDKQLRTILLMLRHSEQPVTPEWIAKELNTAVSDALDHLKYWEEKGIITADTDSTPQISSPTAQMPAASEKNSVASADIVPSKVHIAPTGQKVTFNARQRLTASDINRMAQKDSNIPLLLQETQLLLGKELTPSQTGLLMELYTDYNLSPQYIFTNPALLYTTPINII